MRLLKYLNKRSDTFLVVLGFIFILVLGVIDYLTGSEISFSIFYLLPISLIIWLVGRRAGITMSVASTISWLTADLLAGQTYSYFAIPYWNAIMRLGFFIIVTLALSGLKASRNRQDELGQFIVHDLRSPLSNIIMGLQTLQEIADTNLDDAEIDLIQTCLVSCNRMLTLINSILDLSRLEDGHMPLQVTVWADHNQVNLQYDLAVGVEKVNTDYELTMRVLVNLLSNAIKFSKPQSSVIVRVATLDVDMLTFSVIDQGPGIPREWEDKIFDKFIQVETHKAGGKKSGSGLGLTFSRLAVETLGGHIWIESNLDLGTTISFTLPIRACANSTQ
jgi:signal transduction histidine kinase